MSLTKQAGLCGGPAERRAGRFLTCVFLIKTKTLAVDFEEPLSRFPVLPLAAHSFAEDARVQFSPTCFAYSVHHSIGFSRQLLTQTFLEIWCNISRQAQHVNERVLGARFFRSFQQHRNVSRSSEERRVGKEG